MARTDLISSTLVKWMDLAFNDEDNAPAGGVSGGCQLRPGMGLPALDAFDDCTLAWVMAGVRGNTETFPAMSDVVTSCGGRSVAEFSVGIARCSTALGVDGFLPSLETMEQEFAVQEQDKDRLISATCRATRELEENGGVVNTALLPVEVYGPEGGTVAVYRTIIVEIGRRTS